MKNLIIIACLGTILLTFGCGKKGETPPATHQPIEGKWMEDSAKFVSYKSSQVTGTSKESKPDGSYFQLNSNGKGVNYQPAYQDQLGSHPAITINITYTLTQSKLSLIYPAYTSGDGTYYDPYTDVWTVLTLNDHQLAIRYSEAENDGNDPANDLVQYFYYSK